MEFDTECVLDDLNQRDAVKFSSVLVIFGCIILLGSVGNAMSLYIYSRNFKDSNSRCFFILLSIVEFFSSTTSVPMEIYNLVNHYSFTNGRLCKTFVFTEICQVEIGYILLVLIAVDRWRKVCYPFGRQISVTMAKIFCFVLVPIGVIVASPSLALYGRQNFDVDINTSEFPSCHTGSTHNYTLNVSSTITGSRCSVTNEALEGVLPTLYSVLFWCLFLCGTVILTVLYVQIIQIIRAHDLKRERSARKTNIQENSKYSRPKYAPQESIDMDCETDPDVRTKSINTCYTEAVDAEPASKETSIDGNNIGGVSSKPFRSSPVRYEPQVKPYMISRKTDGQFHDSLPKQDKQPQIKVIEVESFSFHNSVFSTPFKSMTAIPDNVLLSPYAKQQIYSRSADKAPDRNHSVVKENIIDVFEEIGRKPNNQTDLHASDNTSEVTNTAIKDNEVLPKHSRYRTFLDLRETGGLAPIEECRLKNYIVDNTRNGTETYTNEKDLPSSKNMTGEICKQNRQIPHYKTVDITDSEYDGATKGIPINNHVTVPRHTDPCEKRKMKQERDMELSADDDKNPRKRTALCTLATKFKVRTLKRQTTKRQTRSRNVTTVMLAITISNVICFLPYLILSLLRSLVTDFETNLNGSARVAYSLFVRSMYFKSVTNPIIYGLFDSRYRQVLLKIVRRPLYRS